MGQRQVGVDWLLVLVLMASVEGWMMGGYRQKCLSFLK